LWAGRFNKKGREFMRAYTVSGDGALTVRGGKFQVPAKTQGLVVTDDVFVYSTSHGRKNRSNIYVVKRGEGSSDLDRAKLSCFRAPTMSEGMAVYGDDVYLAYESGASYYLRGDNNPDNVIENLHKAPLAELARLTR
jgi:glutamine cyclotransferase